MGNLVTIIIIAVILIMAIRPIIKAKKENIYSCCGCSKADNSNCGGCSSKE